MSRTTTDSESKGQGGDTTRTVRRRTPRRKVVKELAAIVAPAPTSRARSATALRAKRTRTTKETGAKPRARTQAKTASARAKPAASEAQAGRGSGGERRTKSKPVKGQRPKRSSRTPTKRRTKRVSRWGSAEASDVFPSLNTHRPCYGLGTFVAVAEAFGETSEMQVARVEAFGASPGPGAAARKFASRARLEELARVLSAFGSAHRLQILTSLLYGPATYRTLQRASDLKAGPFYHHINQLRLAGFLGPKTRDLYVLTRAGRNALLVALSLSSLIKDRRIRPLPVEPGEAEA